ncbi:GTP cyclohydrolase II /3,4-dihydroxy-2-butanone 4-phosphate synthase [Archaeoglobus sulfaticallidus PM70-1]|uniref:GTP cyclohydrolase-2 n=1 Tax=Archaeoglobus sulfaticallidus PM70-1 TaxID=387631 RepID=N0BN28_9EURY|nr:GTP cyclohydrolase II [Archaeoglobus sulfaticallidus]AGK62001.1 GTP cyclohydrolase II /3,4-dihydroxy-2-butanone 4-phosphate synthase [Archaeoglobus sulfaticallidus PM70-1]
MQPKPCVVVDKNKAVVSHPAEIVTSKEIAFMMKNCDELRVALPWETISQLGLNKFKFFGENSIPIDFKTNGSSAEEKAEFIRNLVKNKVSREEIIYPGRIFIEVAKKEGVLDKPAFAEACLDIARMDGYIPASVFSYLMTPDGKLANEKYARKFAEEHGLRLFSIQELIFTRLKNEKLVERVVTATLPTKFYGTFKAVGYKTPIGEIVALVKGNVTEGEVMVRIHSECLTGDVFHSLRCDCGDQLENALKRIDSAGKGVLIYMRGHEGRGIGLINKLMAYKLQEEGKDTVEANLELGFPPDMRSYGISAQILMDLGVKKILLMTNNPLKIEELRKYGFEVKRMEIEVEPCRENLDYLKAKKEKMGHMICRVNI